MTAPMLPWVGSPRCEWTPRKALSECGELATHHATTHDFLGTDPNGWRTWMLCVDCALNVLAWAQAAHADGDGFMCHGCNSLLTPVLGAFIRSHGVLSDPDNDVIYPSNP